MSLPSIDSLRTDLQTLQPASGTGESIVRETREALATARVPGLGGPTDPPGGPPSDLAGYIDHTELHPEATTAEVTAVIDDAREYGFASVCIAPTHVPRAAAALDGTAVDVCTVVGFPHGANRSTTKAHEAHTAVIDGAREVDLVLNVGAIRDGRFGAAEADVRAVVEAAQDAADKVDASRDGLEVKVILETALLTDAQKAVACTVAKRAGATFVKTSTGFADGGATAEDVALMRQIVGDACGVKASGGVGSASDARRMIAHGATRIGASGSVGIVTGTSA
jgi:deoxyribose-phosphate aldolase